MSLRTKALGLIGGLVAANLLTWVWAFAALRGGAALLGMALLAYGLGLRHAVDADHIAAIDNVTRKLMQDGQQPLGVGLFFALGHSSMVIVAAGLIGVSATAIERRYPGLLAVGGAIGTASSAAFLLAVALVNGVLLVGIYRVFRRSRRGLAADPTRLDALLARRGLIAWGLRRLFGLISHSWQMCLLGALFALGFDTASEVALMGLAASHAAAGAPFWAVLVFPLLFAAGMSLVDTADGLLMLGAYGWAFANPARKLYYNLVITALSVVVAAAVGAAEALGLVADKFGRAGGIWDLVSHAGSGLGFLGYCIIAVFAIGWAGSVLLYRLLGYDESGSA